MASDWQAEVSAALLVDLLQAVPCDWIVLRVHARCEARAVEEVRRLGCFGYLPTVMDRRYSRRLRREVPVIRPMFPGYVFAGATDMRRLALVGNCDHVAGVITADASGRAARVGVSEMVRIVRASEEAMRSSHWDDGQIFDIGERVRLTSGPFEGQEFEVERLQGGRVCGVIDVLGGPVPLVVGVDTLARVSR